MSIPAPWHRLVDDAAIFPPGQADLSDAVAAHVERRGLPHADLVGGFVTTDERLPEVRAAAAEAPVTVCVVATRGAGGVGGALRLARRHDLAVQSLEIALRDEDDLAGNARRVVAAVDDARAEGLVEDTMQVYVELPGAASPLAGGARGPSAGWLAAADEVAMAEHRLKFRTGGPSAGHADLFPAPATLASWIDAALDRETPFKCTAGLHHAVRHTDPATGLVHHGFLNVLLATIALFDGAGTEEASTVLEEQVPEVLLARTGDDAIRRARRWFTSFGSCSVCEPLDDLTTLGLLEDPR